MAEKPLTTNMQETLKLIAAGRNTQRELTLAQRLAASQLNERGLIVWKHDGGKYVWRVEERGFTELALMRGEVE